MAIRKSFNGNKLIFRTVEDGLWARSYDRELKDIFAIQSDLAQNIATALQVRLSPDERTSLAQKPTESLTAYDHYLRGMAFYELGHKEDNERAISLFRQAIEQDPKFALGYAGLANAYIDRVGRYEGEMFWLDSAIDLCRQTIALDPVQVRGYTALARAVSYKGLDAQADELTRKVLELAPNDMEAIKRAIYQSGERDQFDEGYTLLSKCHLLDPNDPWEPYILGKICAAVGEKELMPKELSKLLAVSPRTIRQWQSSRLIPFHKIGKTVLFDLSKVQAVVDRFERKATALN